MKIVYVPSDMDAPGCYRCLFPARQIAQHGHEVLLPPYKVREKPDGRLQFVFDVKLDPPVEADVWVLQQRMERMWSAGGVQMLRQSGAVTIADVDDNYEELPYWNPAFYGTHPYRRNDGVIMSRESRRKIAKANGWKKTPPNSSNRLHMNAMFENVDALTVSTPYLAELYGKYNSNVHVLRNMLDWDIWRSVRPMYLRESKRLRIGYNGVFSYRRGDLEVLKPFMRDIMLKHPEVDFVANSWDVHEFLDIPLKQRVIVPEYDFYPRDGKKYMVGEKTAVMDIGLVPLHSSGLSEAKSHLKGMEYNAAGIPFVSSDTESYRYWVDASTNGFIAKSRGDWVNFIELLIEDATVRRRMGKAGRAKASRNTVQKNWAQWADVYEQQRGDELTSYARGAIVRGAVQKVSELRSMLEQASRLDPLKTIVEVGSARGGTFWALAQVADPEALLVSVDIPAGSPIDVRGGEDVYHGRDRDRFKEFVGPKQTCQLIDASSQLESTRDAVKAAIGAREIDLLFIDADHRYPGVKRDYQLYSPLVRHGGLIVFHDVIPQNDHRSGVHHLWNELKRKDDSAMEFVGRDNWGMGQWGGIGILVAA